MIKPAVILVSGQDIPCVYVCVCACARVCVCVCISDFFLIKSLLNLLQISSAYVWGFSYEACGTLVSQPRIEPHTLCVGCRSLNHWATKEVPLLLSGRKHLLTVSSHGLFSVSLSLSLSPSPSILLCVCVCLCVCVEREVSGTSPSYKKKKKPYRSPASSL